MTQGPGPTREARIQRTRAWLRYASRDLNGARDMARPGSKASPYQAAFWAQQAAEKALKGALTYAGVRIEETHRLNALAALLPDDWNTQRASNALAELSRYAVQTRYPDLDEPEPTAEDARRAITQAAAVLQAIRRDLEATASPSSSVSSPAPSGHQTGRWGATTTATNSRDHRAAAYASTAATCARVSTSNIGKSAASADRYVIPNGSCVSRSRARATSEGERSTPVTSAPRRARTRLDAPLPHPRSRTGRLSTPPSAVNSAGRMRCWW